MKDVDKIKKELATILSSTKFPETVKKEIRNIYKEYEIISKKMLATLESKQLIDRKSSDNLKAFIHDDCRDDVSMTELIEYEEYEQKREKIIEAVNQILKVLRSDETSRNMQIADLSLKRQEKTKNEKENINFSELIVKSTENEIKSSSKSLIRKIDNMDIKSKEDIDTVKKEYEEKLIMLIEELRAKCPLIEQKMTEHIDNIYNTLNEILEKYELKVQEVKLNPREAFLKRMVVEEPKKMDTNLNIEVNTKTSIKNNVKNNMENTTEENKEKELITSELGCERE